MVLSDCIPITNFILQHDGITITKTTQLAEKPDSSSLVFGCNFTDHMLTANWTEADGWEPPRIHPVENLSLHPASPALHYAIEVYFTVTIFRPRLLYRLILPISIIFELQRFS